MSKWAILTTDIDFYDRKNKNVNVIDVLFNTEDEANAFAQKELYRIANEWSMKQNCDVYSVGIYGDCVKVNRKLIWEYSLRRFKDNE